VLTEDPDNLQAIRLRVDARIGSRMGEEALEDLDRLIDEFPDELAHQEKKFQLLLEAERFDEAQAMIAELREAAEGRTDLVEGADALFCVREAQIVVRRGAVDEASRQIDSCLERYPDARPVLNQAIGYYDQTGDKDRALEILRSAVEARPDDLEFQYLLADHLDPEEAERLLTEAAERVDKPGAWITLRNYQVQHDDMEGALASTDRLL
jgi:predicted Zn-dependent protease